VKARTGKPVLALCHNLVSHERRKLDELATRGALGGVDGLLLQSDDDLRRARDLVKGKLLWRVNHPVWADLAQYKIPVAEARQVLGLSGPTILFFGLVREHKGLADLLAALPQVLERTEATLLVVGEFWDERQKYERMIRDLGIRAHVRLVDRYVSDQEMGRYFSASDLVVLPYRRGTQSGVVATAYAFARPVVATAVGGLPEVVWDGVTGHVVAPNSNGDLAARIVDCLAGSRYGRYESGVAAARRHLSWENLVRTIEQATEAANTKNQVRSRGA
jgi:glycosyltransferase involved in cell wall biosynthesis